LFFGFLLLVEFFCQLAIPLAAIVGDILFLTQHTRNVLLMNLEIDQDNQTA